jgi:alanyl-tRNA synthetase
LRSHVSSEDVRRTFLSFFEKHDHHLIGGSSVIPKNDPTLLYINSGMAPLKAYFTGQQVPEHRDLCNVQPCLRTKDIDDVGDRHHLTFFEMLGSWSIGHYFKARAIELAYELLTEEFKFDPERLWVTVFGGEPSLDLAPDDESAQWWESVGVPRNRIVRLGTEDNFWGPAGETGPCGPCTEVFYDFGDAYGPAYVPGGEFDTTSRYIEIWNAGVFMQFDKRRDGSFGNLPFVSVDTGAGLERLAMALNDLPSVYETDLLSPLVAAAQDLLGDSGEALDHHRLLADHMRAATFIMSEGVRPSNEGRGYIPRRLIRKSIAVARLKGAGSQHSLRELSDAAIDLMSPHYPKLGECRDEILSSLAAEEAEFSRVVERGLDRLEELLERSPDRLSGSDAFQLLATYGLPFEITRDLAVERGATVSLQEFNREYEGHQQKSRATGGRRGRLSVGDPLPDLPRPTDGQFVGYLTTSGDADIVAIFQNGERVESAARGAVVEVLLDRTPFYAEGGGQVGDTGALRSQDGTEAKVTDTTSHGSGYHVHQVEVASGKLFENQVVRAEVDTERRRRLAANHSATHLLNAALRQVVGPHVKQAGSRVDPERLRFDFTNQGSVPMPKLLEIERIVNHNILRDLARTTQVLDAAGAKQTGAVFLDDEEYGDSIRVVQFGDASIEFCGGTHVDASSQIGLFRISKEEAVASGVRRIIAVTRDEALDLTLERDRLLMTSAALLKVNPSDLPARVEKLATQPKAAAPTAGSTEVTGLSISDVAGTPVAGAVVDSTVELRPAAQHEAKRLGAVVVLLSSTDEKALVAVAVPPTLTDKVSAKDVLQRLLAPIEGRGGGSDVVAQGGGRADQAGLRAVLDSLPAAIHPG